MSLDDPRSSREVVRALLTGAPGQRSSLVQSVEGLLSGIGYNLRDAGNLARANDQLVRARAAALLVEAADALTEREARFRDAHVPAPTREQPYPDAQVMQALRGLDGLRNRVRELSSAVLTLEAPADDQLWRRLREEQPLLEELLSADVGLVAGAHDVVQAARDLSTEEVRRAKLAIVEAPVQAVERAVRARRSLLEVVG